ncbi:hypothetical protein H6G11_16445 [Cyanobacterium aponinum FACHB-4101]|uniref:Uncharacterized protein n=1 Tax=Cyanobacterium aponinum 0216 TaxID=2676140 RepID=A0A844GQM7_9CHRO|nr:hypothetical protein [Cyanobacterium aponinum]MBD2395835.1 hypothetical protein [Cyanobacterium aponinum FACHB-4101]MTF38854.1 hypothetical protein [Cyanobacterium aponinum 0216]
MSKLLISLLFFTGLIFNFTLSISPVFSHEGYSHFREKYKSQCEINNNRFTKDNDDKKEEKDKEEDHEGHHQH